MTTTRRDFFAQTLTASLAGWTLGSLACDSHAATALRIAPFRFDVTPPEGHSLCGGWIKPVVGVDDPLEAIGLVLLGAGEPIVLCAVDWTGLLNGAHVAWRAALAEAAGTTPDRVAVQCVHQHNAPFACLNSEAIVAAQGDLPHIIEIDYFNACLDRGRDAIRKALPAARPVTHIAHGQARWSRWLEPPRIAGRERRRQGHAREQLHGRGAARCRRPDRSVAEDGRLLRWRRRSRRAITTPHTP